MVLFHHAPPRTDDELDGLRDEHGAHDPLVVVAVEGMALEVEPAGVRTSP